MSRRNRPPNRWGCKPDEDVCVAHDMPLICRHGCRHVAQHKCKELDAVDDAAALREVHGHFGSGHS